MTYSISILKAIFVLAISTFAFPLLCTAQETTLRVMSMHMQFAKGSDGRVDLPRIAAVLKQGNADIIALQGVDRGTKRVKKTDQARLLAAELKMNYVFAKTQSEDGGETGNAILSRFPIGPHKMLGLPNAGNHLRAVLVAVIKVGKGRNAKEIRFASTALGGGDSGQLRQMEKLNDYFFIEGEDTPVIIGAHFYVTRMSKPIEEMRKRWVDSFDVVQWESAEGSEGNEKREMLEGPVEKRVNYIFFRSKDSIKVTERRLWGDPILVYPPVLSVLIL